MHEAPSLLPRPARSARMLHAALPFRRLLAPRSFVILTLTVGLLGSVHAQEPTASPTPPLQVLQQQTVDVGSHRITFNRVVPPTPQPTPPAKLLSSALTINGAGPTTESSTTEEDETDFHALFIGATVYDGQFTDLHGADANGTWHAWSNVDFNLLASVSAFGTTTATYSLYLFHGNDTVDSLTQAGLYPAGLASLPAGRAGYFFTDGSTAAGHPETAAALDALHRYADAYRPQLLQTYQQRLATQAAAAAQAEWARLHPTPPPDTVINFWPQQNSIYLGR